MTAKGHPGIRQDRPGNGPQSHAAGLARGKRGRANTRTPEAYGSSQAVFEQLAIVIPKPRLPADPPLPPLPDRRPRDMTRAVFDALAAMCRCQCGQNFADERAWAAHRPNGRCVPPAQAGLTRRTTPCPCWGQPPKEKP